MGLHTASGDVRNIFSLQNNNQGNRLFVEDKVTVSGCSGISKRLSLHPGESQFLHNWLLEQHQLGVNPRRLRSQLEVDADHPLDGLLQQGPGHPHRGSHQDVLHEEHASAGPQHGILDVCHGQFEILTICVLKVPDLVTSVFELVKVKVWLSIHRRQRQTVVRPLCSTRCSRTCTARTMAPSTGLSTDCLQTSESLLDFPLLRMPCTLLQEMRKKPPLKILEITTTKLKQTSRT